MVLAAKPIPYGQNIQPNLGGESKTSKLPAHKLSVIIVSDA
jgi:hypothetical protein